jgi:hypothetical protein
MLTHHRILAAEDLSPLTTRLALATGGTGVEDHAVADGDLTDVDAGLEHLTGRVRSDHERELGNRGTREAVGDP